MVSRGARIIWLSLGVVFSGSAYADGILGLGLGHARFPSYAPGVAANVDLGSDTGLTFFAAYRDEQLPLMFELSYVETGEPDARLNGLKFATLGFKGLNATGGYLWRASSQPLAAWFRLGFYDGESSVQLNTQASPNFEERSVRDSSGLSMGIGGEWMFDSRFGLRLSYDSLQDVADFSESNQRGESRVDLITLGLLISLGSSSAPVVTAPRVAPVVPSPAPMAAPEKPTTPTLVELPQASPVIPEPPPPPTIPAEPPPITLPAVKAGANLISQPKADGRVVQNFSARQSIRLLSSISTPEGNWYYVNVPGTTNTGWLAEADVER